MARKARERSESGVYHILLRKQEANILASSDDAVMFLEILGDEKAIDALEVYAYCLFEGYIHLVIKEGISGISTNVMRVCARYATYFNETYSSVGKLFKDRFISEPLHEMDNILDCTRFIHRLPIVFGQDMDYDFSSYKNYFSKNELLSSSDIIGLIGSQIDYRVYCDEVEEGKYRDNISSK